MVRQRSTIVSLACITSGQDDLSVICGDSERTEIFNHGVVISICIGPVDTVSVRRGTGSCDRSGGGQGNAFTFRQTFNGYIFIGQRCAVIRLAAGSCCDRYNSLVDSQRTRDSCYIGEVRSLIIAITVKDHITDDFIGTAAGIRLSAVGHGSDGKASREAIGGHGAIRQRCSVIGLAVGSSGQRHSGTIGGDHQFAEIVGNCVVSGLRVIPCDGVGVVIFTNFGD